MMFRHPEGWTTYYKSGFFFRISMPRIFYSSVHFKRAVTIGIEIFEDSFCVQSNDIHTPHCQ